MVIASEAYTGKLRLRDYQVAGRDFLFERHRVMLADDAGLGKTPQAAYAAVTPCLVVAPKYLIRQWYEWLRGEDWQSLERNSGEIVPNVDGTVVLVDGSRERKAELIRLHADWTVISMDTLRTHTAVLLECTYETMILDESHHFRHWKSARSKAAVELGRVVPRVYELTASPVMHEVDDLYSQLRILDPKVFKSYWRFAATFCELESDNFGTKVVGFKKSSAVKLNNVLSWWKLGRTYADAGREVPPIIEKYIRLELPPVVMREYNKVLGEYRNDFLDMGFLSWMEAFVHLRRVLTGTWKLETVAEIMADAAQQGRVVWFSWYKDTAYSVQQAIKDAGYECEAVTGDQQESLRRLRARGPQHISATIESISEGIDLSDARTVVFFEEDHIPGTNYQALRRVVRERVGVDADNSVPVVVYYVHCAGTVDEVIHRRTRSREGRITTIEEIVRETLESGSFR